MPIKKRTTKAKKSSKKTNEEIIKALTTQYKGRFDNDLKRKIEYIGNKIQTTTDKAQQLRYANQLRIYYNKNN